MRFTRARDLVLAGVIGLGLGYPLFDLAYSAMPDLPILAGGTLAVLAVLELIAAGSVRGRIRAGQVHAALFIARLVALAKASSILGALMLGGWLAALIYLVPLSSEVRAAADDTPSAVVGVACAAGLLGAALWLEHSCRTPDKEEWITER